MWMLFWVVILAGQLALGLATAAFAGDRAAVAPLARSGFESLPERMQQDLRQRPERFLEAVAELIIGHGHGGTIGEAGIERFIALERARVRAYHLRRLQQADLDGDGAVTLAELAALQHVSSARQRGLLELEHRRADSDRDGTVNTRELRWMAEGKALAAMSDADAAGYRAILSFDLDGSGGVSLDEVVHALAAFRGEPV